MPSTFTPNKVYELQATGENTGTWGTLLDAVLSQIDLNLGGYLPITVAGVDITLSSAQARNLLINFNGILNANINVNFPANKGGLYLINNTTTGTGVLTVRPLGGTGTVIQRGGVWPTAIYNTLNTAVNATVTSILSTRGDLLYRDANGVQRLAVGAANRTLVSNGIDPAWGQVPLATGVTGSLPIANGGTGQITAGATNQVLTGSASTSTVWAVPNVSSVTGVLPIANGGTGSASALIPAGSSMIFYNATAPTGWVQLTGAPDYAMRIVSGVGGTSGGSQPFSSIFTATRVTNGHTLTAAELALHTHGYSGTTGTQSASGSTNYTHSHTVGSGPGNQFRTNNPVGAANFITIQGTGAVPNGVENTTSTVNTDHAHGFSGTTDNGSPAIGAAAHSHTIDMSLRYLDMILCQKS